MLSSLLITQTIPKGDIMSIKEWIVTIFVSTLLTAVLLLGMAFFKTSGHFNPPDPVSHVVQHAAGYEIVSYPNQNIVVVRKNPDSEKLNYEVLYDNGQEEKVVQTEHDLAYSPDVQISNVHPQPMPSEETTGFWARFANPDYNPIRCMVLTMVIGNDASNYTDCQPSIQKYFP